VVFPLAIFSGVWVFALNMYQVTVAQRGTHGGLNEGTY
jgi:hypothetical protein